LAILGYAEWMRIGYFVWRDEELKRPLFAETGEAGISIVKKGYLSCVLLERTCVLQTTNLWIKHFLVELLVGLGIG